MPPEHGTPEDWVRYAKRDLGLASIPASDDAMRECLAFHIQQAVEKSIKAVLVSRSIDFPYTHNLKILLDLLPSDLSLPVDADEVAGLTDYVVSGRYPGEYEPVTKEDFDKALRLTESVVKWAEDTIGR